MSATHAVHLLQLVHFLRGVGEDGISELLRSLRPKTFQAGQVLHEQGTPVHAMDFIVRGRVQLAERAPSGEVVRRVVLSAGDTIGESELVYDLPWLATIEALETTRVLRWDRGDIQLFLEKNPAVLGHMRFAAQSRQLARALRFPWLGEEEVIFGLARKHPFLLLQGLILPALLLAGAAGFAWWALLGAGSLMGWVALGLALAGVAYGIWRWIDWGNDYYIVTDRRAVWLEKVVALYDSRREAPLHQVLSVSVSTTVLGRLLGYGDVIIRTFTSQVVFKNLKDPRAMAAMVDEHYRRAQIQREEEDLEVKARAIRGIVDADGDAEELPAAPPSSIPDGSQKPRRSEPSGLGRWTFKTRFEEEGAIVYRKHQAVLLGHIWLPSIAILVVVGAFGARLGGLITLFTPLTFLIGTLIWLIPLAVWWVYGYVDWRDDIYLITPTHIVDIYRKPLGREVQRVAPLENILGTEVDRRGIIGLLLNFGNVVANIGTAQFDFEGVSDPTGVQQDIVRAQEALMERKRRAEEKKQRDQMVEWLNVYHRFAHPPED